MAKLLHTCDACRARKIRCIRHHAADPVCIHCQKRGEACHFSRFKTRQKRALHHQAPSAPRPSEIQDQVTEASGSASGTTTVFSAPSCLPKGSESAASACYTASVAKNPKAPQASPSRSFAKPWRIQARDDHAASNTMEFFSDSLGRSLGDLFGHDQWQRILSRLEASIERKFSCPQAVRERLDAARRLGRLPKVSPVTQARYVNAFFDEVHPFYPVLDRRTFEQTAFGSNAHTELTANPAWCALYFAVLTLGCLNSEGGTWFGGEGREWEFFTVCLARMPDLLFTHRNLTTVQAFLFMAVYGTCYGGLSVEETMITEAARSAFSVGLGKLTNVGASSAGTESRKTFWVIYSLEKEYAFNTSRASLIDDADVSPERTRLSGSDELDYLQTYASYAHLLSDAYRNLYSTTAKPSIAELDRVYSELSTWRDSIPKAFRPGLPIQPRRRQSAVEMQLKVRLHMIYYNALIALSRLALQMCSETERISHSKAALLSAARSIVDLTQHLNIAPSASTLLNGHIPLSALFVLFDFVVHNPKHAETATNLAFLDIASGYFTRSSIASGGLVDGQAIADLVHLARLNVKRNETGDGSANRQFYTGSADCPGDYRKAVSWGSWGTSTGSNDGAISGPIDATDNTALDARDIKPVNNDCFGGDALWWAQDLESLTYPLENDFLSTLYPDFGTWPT